MPIDYGQTYAQGVKYLKINRYDSGGLDRSDYLGQLTDLTINYTDLGPIQYNIITTQEQDTYFIYGIQTRNQSTSSVNYNILSSSITIQDTSSFNTNIDAPTYVGVDVASFYTVLSGDANLLGNFGSYKVPRTPNIQLSLTISASYTNSSGTTADARLSYGTYNDDSGQTSTIGVSGVTSIPNGASGVLVYKWDNFGSTILKDNLLNAKVFGLTTNTSNLNISNFKVIISQSQAPNFNYPTLTIFDPEFIDWDYNDYNALFGNAETPQFSTQLMDVDYTSTFTTPVNFDLIISGTADRAQVQDSNYSSQAWSNIRYNGIRSNSPGFNQLTADGGYGFLPNVEQNKTYIAYFDAVGGTGPEIIGQTAYFIKYIIDENGDVINPEPDTIALYNLLDSYESGEKAIVRLISGDPNESANVNDDSLTGLHPITHVGRISPILMSETGSNLSDTASILYFDDFARYSTISTSDYGFRAITINNISVPWNDPEINVICNLETSASSNYDNTTGVYTFPEDTSLYNNRVMFTADGQIRGTFAPFTPVNSVFTVTIGIKKNGVFLTYQDVVFKKTNNLSLTYTQPFTLKTTFQTFNTGDTVTLTFDGIQPSVSVSSNILVAGIEFKAQNEYPANPITATAPYWTVGSYLTGSNVSVLTSSLELVNIYGSSFYQSQSQDMLTWGFSPVSLAFQPQVGDFIRIEYNPDKVFNITKVEATDRLYLTVVPPIPSGSVLNHFCLYRIVNDGTYIILDVNKIQAGNSFTGIIQPEYISQTLKDNYSNIIQNLTQEGLIS
jgi:hypothetical protein